MELTLLPDEYSIKELTDKSVCLTSHRLIAEHKEFGRCYVQSAILENISSTSLQHVSKAWHLFMGVSCAAAVLIFSSHIGAETIILAVGLFVFFIVRFLMSRKTLIQVVSPKSLMEINVTQIPHDIVMRFLQDIEEAKNNRLQALRNTPIA
jgi:hypothetical protein